MNYLNTYEKTNEDSRHSNENKESDFAETDHNNTNTQNIIENQTLLQIIELINNEYSNLGKRNNK